MADFMLKDVAFVILTVVTLGSAACVTFSKKIVYSGFALLGTFGGAAGFFILLSSDFVAATQILIYVGGILILILFAIMLTRRIGDVNLTNLSVNHKVALPMIVVLAALLISLVTRTEWLTRRPEVYASLIKPIGNALLKEYLLPFEIISVVLLGALLGAIVIVRREVK